MNMYDCNDSDTNSSWKTYPVLPKLEYLLMLVEESLVGTENPGFCLACGAELYYCEPDMVEGPCEICGEHAVFGAEEILFLYTPDIE